MITLMTSPEVITESNDDGIRLMEAMRQTELATLSLQRAGVGADPYEFLDEYLARRVEPLGVSPDGLDEQILHAIARNAMTGRRAKQLQEEAQASFESSQKTYNELLEEFYMRTVLVARTNRRATDAITLVKYAGIDERPEVAHGKLISPPHLGFDAQTLVLAGFRTTFRGKVKRLRDRKYLIKPFGSLLGQPNIALQILDS